MSASADTYQSLLMFFILSKVLFFLLVPFWWIVLLFIWMRFSRSPRRKRQLLTAIIIIAVAFTNPWLYGTTVLAWQPEPVTIPNTNTYDAGIVLGGLSGYDKYNRGYFGDNADRFIQTANLYHRGIIKKILITGGNGTLSGNEPAEAFFLRSAFIDNGVPDSNIFIESKSRNTYENAVFTKQLIDSLHINPPFVLVTSALHMTRSEKVFRKVGYDIRIFPCDYKVSPADFNIAGFIVPNISLLDKWSLLLKEIVGLYVYKLTGKA